MSKYEHLDELILNLVSTLKDPCFMHIEIAVTNQVRRKPDSLGLAIPIHDVMRTVDRRLQALRKAEKIKYNGKQWELR